MGTFHDRMAEDLQIRGLSLNTQRAYLRCMRQFVGYFKRSPNLLGAEDIRTYQLYLTRERKISWSAFNQKVAALKFFYHVTLGKKWAVDQIPYQKTPSRRLAEILSVEKVATLLSAPDNLKHRAILMTLYAAGLRAGEAVHLKVADIDTERRVIRVDQGKGRKDRYVMLSARLLDALREYERQAHPTSWLFPGGTPDKPLAVRSVHKILSQAQEIAGIPGRIHPHMLRHSFATHLMENGVSIRVIQTLLGHGSVRTTEKYTHVSRNLIEKTKSPLDLLPGFEPRLCVTTS